MIIDKWKDEYFNINKVNSILNQFEVTGTTKRFCGVLQIMVTQKDEIFFINNNMNRLDGK